jgi:hypothetical protein
MRWPVLEPNHSSAANQHSRRGHETTDVRPSYIGVFALALILMIALVLVVLHWTMRRLEAVAERADPVASPLAGDQAPPEPRLQADTVAELASVRREEDQRLMSYGWIDRQARIVRLPIERAIDILVERGLPEPKGPVELPREKERTP